MVHYMTAGNSQFRSCCMVNPQGGELLLFVTEFRSVLDSAISHAYGLSSPSSSKVREIVYFSTAYRALLHEDPGMSQSIF